MLSINRSLLRRCLTTSTSTQLKPIPSNVTICDTREHARELCDKMLRDLSRKPDQPIHYCAADTEVMDIDIKKESPVGHGVVTCASVYCGPNYDFGNGSILWIDNLGSAEGVLTEFKPFFESDSVMKVWHNYSFDRHVLYNHGIDCRGFGGDTLHMARLWNSSRKGRGGYSLSGLTHDLLDVPKSTMMERFGDYNVLKDGTKGKIKVVPDVLTLQTDEKYRRNWIDYSAQDAVLTWQLREVLESLLREWEWGDQLTLWDFYWNYWKKFGEILTDMERVGFYVRQDSYLKKIEKEAYDDITKAEEHFRKWALKYRPECRYMNVGSDAQKQQLLFAPYDGASEAVSMPATREFKTLNEDQIIMDGKTKPLKHLTFEIKGMGLPVEGASMSGKPSVDAAAIKKLCGDPYSDPPKYGAAYRFFNQGDEGREACVALAELNRVRSIKTLVNTFIRPLEEYCDENGRVHCSLNIGTETGRLSSRCPNLQNQPAYDKDIYKVRKAFSAPEGKTLIVADYGQLELRVLAHMTNCKSMIEAFRLGGDFHSRTAMNMYENVASAVKAGTVLVEKGPDAPENCKTIKEAFPNERKKAKILNFSIAYGKTAHGLAMDWGVSVSEAKDTLKRWYADRPEVQAWQQYVVQRAREQKITKTLMGRNRILNDILSSTPRFRKHSERQAINTAVQGGGADVVMMAMIRVSEHPRLKELGWKMVLQIHDEIIIEGPKESQEEAYEILVDCMEHPFKEPLAVELAVDAKIASNWYDAK